MRTLTVLLSILSKYETGASHVPADNVILCFPSEEFLETP